MNNTDPIKHLENITYIEKYIKEACVSYNSYGDEYLEHAKIRLIIEPFGILFASKNSSYYEALLNSTTEQIENLANYIRNYTGNKVGLQEFFHSPHAVKILENNTKYENMNVYLKECLAIFLVFFLQC